MDDTPEKAGMVPPSSATVTMTRRIFLQDMIIASVATAGLTSGSLELAAQAAPAAGSPAFNVITHAEGECLAAVLDRLIPAEGAMPGAGELGIAHYVDNLLLDAPDLRAPIVAILSAVRSAGAKLRGGIGVLDNVLERLSHQDKPSFDVLVQACYAGYYSHPQVLQALGAPTANTQGVPQTSFDVAILEPVLKRGSDRWTV
jgi:hypothetical protein